MLFLCFFRRRTGVKQPKTSRLTRVKTGVEERTET
nr:MAG TPA: hypothetical protein [Caudoviricetes sp.]